MALVSFLSVVGPVMEFLLSRRISRPIRAVVGSVLASLMTTLMPNNQAKLFRLLVYRELGMPLSRYDSRRVMG